MTAPKKGEFLALSALFFDDPDIEPLRWDDRAFFIAMGCKVRALHSDGWLTEAQVAKLGYPRWRRALPCLVTLGLITAHTDAHGRPAYYLPGYLKWNWSEEAWLRKKHEGTLWACKGHHQDPPPCDRESCRAAATWLSGHPKPSGVPNG